MWLDLRLFIRSEVTFWMFLSSNPGVPGELPGPGPHPAVQPGPLAGPPVDADQRGVGHQRPERRLHLRAQVRGLQPGGDDKEDPVHPDVGGIHRPQVTQVRPAATVRNLRVGPQTSSFFLLLSPHPLSLLSDVFHFGFAVFNFYPFFFVFFIYYIWIYIYITHVWIYWSFYVWFGWQQKRDLRRDYAHGSLTLLWLCAHTVCVSVCLCTCVCVCVCTCVNTITRSFSFRRRCSQTRRDHLRFLTSPQRLCCLAHSFIFMGRADRRTNH